MAKFAVVLPAAGKSSRFQTNQKRKKPFVDLKKRPIWVRAADQFVNREDVVQTLIVIASEDMDFFKEKYRANLAFMEIDLIEGGVQRADSVENALKQVKDEVDFVAVHDAARPLIVKEWIDEVFAAAEKSGAAIPAVPISSTIKRVGDDSQIEETVSRDGLWAAQTPQVFRRELLLEAYAQRGDFNPTDEAQLVEKFGHPVTVVRGNAMNIKITTGEDMSLATALVDALPKKTLGALHPFADEPRGLL
ncbi:MAG: 2-C-methyl-D-erythritol 4-phosphate cytidylyltransferase [Planctomycetaceae bacterium]|nr:2-C-methyl-D-erythritol 4-phosphate cytidylyltransferase [Planctomycetaceae bacterium]